MGLRQLACRDYGFESIFKGQEVRSPRLLDTKIGPISCPETSEQNYRSTLRNIAEERRSHLHRGGSVTSRKSKSIIHFSLQSACPHLSPIEIPTVYSAAKHTDRRTQYAICPMDSIRALKLKTQLAYLRCRFPCC